ncbi:MAG: 50S ribosomal protein L13 [Bacteroidales bacterium]|nr:50S ribosomal protein L13 [Bacteroidales bacterium]
MNTLSYKTVSANKNTVQKEWVLVDAENQVLGRLASNVAYMLRGKHKPDFTPHVDCGANVIIINAEKVLLTGNKLTDRKYVSYSGYPGGKKEQTPEDILKKYPERLIERAVKGMLPKNKLSNQLFRNMYVYAGNEHPHEAQKPEKIDINEIK